MTMDTPAQVEDIKPQITETEAISLADTLFGLEVTSIKELNAYDDKNFHVYAAQSTNKNIDPISPHGYVLKIINSFDSKDADFFQAQTEILLILGQDEISAPIPMKSIEGEYLSFQQLKYNNTTRVHIVRLFQYLPGKILKSVPGGVDLYYQVGVWSARLDLALKGFRHKGIDNHNTMWHLNFTPKLFDYVKHVQDPDRRRLVTQVLNSFCENVVANLDRLEKGVIHGDMNEQNILVDSTVEGKWNISTILDFGDANFGCYLYEVGAAICYMMLEGARTELDPLYCGAATLAGYQSIRPLTQLEQSLLKVTVCARLCQSLVLGLYTQSLQPDNQYVLDTQENGWTVLTQLWTTPPARISKVWSIPLDLLTS